MLAIAAPARADFLVERPAELPVLRVHTPDHGKLVAALHVDGPLVRLDLDLSSRAKDMHEAELSIVIPPGSRAVAMTLGAVPALAMDDHGALARYDDTVRAIRDPALLRQLAPDSLRLRVFPLSRDHVAHVEITLDVPGGAFLFEQSGRTTRIDRVEARHDWMTDDPAPRGVDAHTSLIAAEVPPVRVPIVVLGGAPNPTKDISKADIRRVVKQHFVQLRHCYEQEVQRDWSLAGHVDLHFTIGMNGLVEEVATDGDLGSDTVRACIEDQVKQWKFHEVSYRVAVNYPLGFQLSDR